MESKLVDRISDLKVSNSDDHSHDQDHQDQQQQPQTQPKKEDTSTTTPQKNIVVPDITTPSKEDHKATSLAEEELVINDNNKDDVEDDNDGFKTPTGLEHKIPAMRECPPAPRKSRLLRKRKVSSSPPGRMIQPASFELQQLQQLQAFFAPTFLLPDLRAKIKKARRD